MLRTFIGYARLCRFFGCLYISNINDCTLRTSKASWKSVYTLYSLAWLVMMAIFEGYSISNKIGCDNGWNCSFGKFLGTISHSICAFKVFWSVVCVARGSRKILKFLRCAADYEVSSSFEAPPKFCCNRSLLPRGSKDRRDLQLCSNDFAHHLCAL
ncbi:hypothetical protein MRX96_041100 [Rhipicephalus microplus]